MVIRHVRDNPFSQSLKHNNNAAFRKILSIFCKFLSMRNKFHFITYNRYKYPSPNILVLPNTLNVLGDLRKNLLRNKNKIVVVWKMLTCINPSILKFNLKKFIVWNKLRTNHLTMQNSNAVLVCFNVFFLTMPLPHQFTLHSFYIINNYTQMSSKVSLLILFRVTSPQDTTIFSNKMYRYCLDISSPHNVGP